MLYVGGILPILLTSGNNFQVVSSLGVAEARIPLSHWRHQRLSAAPSRRRQRLPQPTSHGQRIFHQGHELYLELGSKPMYLRSICEEKRRCRPRETSRIVGRTGRPSQKRHRNSALAAKSVLGRLRSESRPKLRDLPGAEMPARDHRRRSP